MRRVNLDGSWIAWIARVAAVATFLASLYLLFAPHPVGSGLAPDWLGHLALFAALGVWAGLWAAAGEPGTQVVHIVTGLVTVIAYGLLSEVAQGFTGRDPQLSDALVNIAGAILGFGSAYTVCALLSRVRNLAQ